MAPSIGNSKRSSSLGSEDQPDYNTHVQTASDHPLAHRISAIGTMAFTARSSPKQTPFASDTYAADVAMHLVGAVL